MILKISQIENAAGFSGCVIILGKIKKGAEKIERRMKNYEIYFFF